MLFTRKIVLPAMAVAIFGSGLFGISYVSAQSSTASPIVQKIAQKFGLSTADVQAVFDEDIASRHAQKRTELEARLTRAVLDGKITEAQKQAILNKLEDFEDNKPNFEQFKNMTAEQRKQAMLQKKTELEDWASQNGLTVAIFQELIGRGKGGMHHGFGWGR